MTDEPLGVLAGEDDRPNVGIPVSLIDQLAQLHSDVRSEHLTWSTFDPRNDHGPSLLDLDVSGFL